MSEFPSEYSAPAAVCWDMDGTLVDTDPYWFEAHRMLIEDHDGTWSEQLGRELTGQALDRSAEILQAAGVGLPVQQIIASELDHVITRTRQHMPWRAGAVQLLSDLRSAQVPCALVTMSYRALADVVIEQCPANTFQVVVTGETVTAGKPHPEPYLTAVAQLGVRPESSVAIEDSPPGVRSAHQAGLQVIAVPHTVALGELARLDRVTVHNNLTEVALTDLDTAVST